jgi:hypothetical protein
MRYNKNKEKYIKAILDIIENKDDYTQSDLQGLVEVLVDDIANDESLLDFETRLQRSKSHDLQ